MTETLTKNLDGRPDTHKVELHRPCLQPLREQLFDTEWEALQEFKRNCPEAVHYEDEFLMATLFSRKMDQERAKALLKINWEWRVENGLEKLPSIDDLDFGLLSYQHSIPGARSKEGNMILYSIIGDLDPSNIDMDKLQLWAAWFFLRGQFFSGLDAHRNGVVMVQDLNGFGWKHMNLTFQKRFAAIFQEKFPMRFKKHVQVNAPRLIKVFINLIKPFMSKKMIERVMIANEEQLIEYIGKENLWSRFGGDLETDESDYVSAIVEYAEWRFGEKRTKPIIIKDQEVKIVYRGEDQKSGNEEKKDNGKGKNKKSKKK